VRLFLGDLALVDDGVGGGETQEGSDDLVLVLHFFLLFLDV